MTESELVRALSVIKPNEGAQSINIKSYRSLISLIFSFSLYSLFFSSTNSISIPTRSMLDWIMSRLGDSVFLIASEISRDPESTWYNDKFLSFGSKPSPEDAFAWGSASIIRTFFQVLQLMQLNLHLK